jgi:hypothetical protein
VVRPEVVDGRDKHGHDESAFCKLTHYRRQRPVATARGFR